MSSLQPLGASITSKRLRPITTAPERSVEWARISASRGSSLSRTQVCSGSPPLPRPLLGAAAGPGRHAPRGGSGSPPVPSPLSGPASGPVTKPSRETEMSATTVVMGGPPPVIGPRVDRRGRRGSSVGATVHGHGVGPTRLPRLRIPRGEARLGHEAGGGNVLLVELERVGAGRAGAASHDAAPPHT